MVCFENKTFFILMDSSLSVFYEIHHGFDVTFLKTLPNTKLFSSRFIILALRFVVH